MSDDAGPAPQAWPVTPDPAPRASLFDTYRPLPGVADELCDAGGRMRRGWAPLIDHLSALDSAATAEAFARGDQHLADAGVFFRTYGDAQAASRD